MNVAKIYQLNIIFFFFENPLDVQKYSYTKEYRQIKLRNKERVDNILRSKREIVRNSPEVWNEWTPSFPTNLL